VISDYHLMFLTNVDPTLSRLETNPMKEFLIQIVQALVDNPEQVQVNQIEGTQTTILELRVANEDMGKIIGKQGRTANAIRTLLYAASGKAGKRYMLEIVD
jgi:predicted RNA-binding protein YlqC (UPF0109 family)